MTSEQDNVLCERCKCVLTEDEADGPIHGMVVCGDCECETFHEYCRLCNTCFDVEDWEPTHFVLMVEVQGLSGALCAGYYRIQRTPFYADGMIVTYIYNDAVTMVAPLTGEEGELWEYGAAHPLCESCTQQRCAEGHP